VSGEGRDSQKGSYLGPAFESETIQVWLDREAIPYERHDPAAIPGLVADILGEEKVVGFFSGRMEFGPRALGGRSIIGDARSTKMQSIMNLKIKYRESFRPFAPSCLVEDVEDLFELDRASPYMLLVANVQERRRKAMTDEQKSFFGIEKLNVPRSDIPAITHIDYSARVQSVDGVDNKPYYDTIQAFKDNTGYGVIVNTSFNVRGEPIVCTPQDAFLCVMRTEMDVLVLENLVLHKTQQKALEGDEDWREQYELD